jgi:RND family efflux transporter MFP subunit
MTAPLRWLPGLAPIALGLAVTAAAAVLSGCATSSSSAAAVEATTPAPIDVATDTVTKTKVRRTFGATGTLLADDRAEVAAEIAGRIVGTPIERGTVVQAGTLLVQVSATEAAAQLAEADANAAQSAAALNLGPQGEFAVDRVPDVANARAELSLAEAEYDRIRSLLDQRVVSRSEYDQRATQVEAARQRHESARNAAQQRYRAYQASLARVTLARKALADTSVRAPFAGVVAERRVSTGDYVTRGTPVATVVRIDPLRVELSIPEQDVARIEVGQPVTFRVDAYPNRSFEGKVRYVSPTLRTDQRALTVEAVVANPAGDLKPGLFVSAEIAEPGTHEALLVSRSALREVGSTRRVFALNGDRLEDRIVTIGQIAGDRVEIVSGVRDGERVALPGGARLADGALVRVVPARASSTRSPAE